MGAYGYVRISRDEDGSKESITSQKDTIKDFAKDQGIGLIDIIEDNDISGYSYNRPGIKSIIELVDNGELDTLVVKDLSRIGRHNAKTLLFMEELEDKGVKILFKSGNNDENFRGLETWYNELYIRDISKKTKDALRTKQKNGEVHVSHFGYMKDPTDKNRCIIDEEAAETVRLLFRLYAEGNGLNKIAKYLNEHHVETPAVRKEILYGYGWKKEWDFKHLWYGGTVKRILKNDVYTGTVRRGVTKRTKIRTNKMTKVAPEEQFVHEGLIPAIIDKAEFESVNATFIKRVENGVRAKNNTIYKYTGLLKCGECGKNLVTIGAKRKEGIVRSYVCTTYQKFGKAYCTGHKLKHDDLDSIIFKELEALYQSGLLKMDYLDKSLEQRQQSIKDNGKVIDRLQTAIHAKRGEIKNYSKQLAKELISEELFLEMTGESSAELEKLERQLIEAENVQELRDNEKEKVASALDILKEIIDKKELTHADVTTLIDKIVVSERKGEGLDLEVVWNTPFMVVSE
ncbi:MAG: recombinase family protein [Desulfosporosinus sp.]|nr:recombinase family protein [Desulfosporosinus sp.]